MKKSLINKLAYNYPNVGRELNLNEEAELYFKDSAVNPLLDPKFCTDWIDYLTRRENVYFVYGGYMEDRRFLWRRSYLTRQNSIHLGVDFSFKAGTPIRSPINGTLIQKFTDEDQNGGWGSRVLIETDKKKLILFAHLSEPIQKNLVISIGDVIGYIGDSHTNGGWFPHLHVQSIRDMSLLQNLDGYSHRYNGIEKDYPNPLPILGIK